MDKPQEDENGIEKQHMEFEMSGNFEKLESEQVEVVESEGQTQQTSDMLADWIHANILCMPDRDDEEIYEENNGTKGLDLLPLGSTLEHAYVRSPTDHDHDYGKCAQLDLEYGEFGQYVSEAEAMRDTSNIWEQVTGEEIPIPYFNSNPYLLVDSKTLELPRQNPKYPEYVSICSAESTDNNNNSNACAEPDQLFSVLPQHHRPEKKSTLTYDEFCETIRKGKMKPAATKRSYNCGQCKRKFAHLESLTEHVRFHHAYKCPDCDRSFPKATSLNNHMRTHATYSIYGAQKTQTRVLNKNILQNGAIKEERENSTAMMTKSEKNQAGGAFWND